MQHRSACAQHWSSFGGSSHTQAWPAAVEERSVARAGIGCRGPGRAGADCDSWCQSWQSERVSRTSVSSGQWLAVTRTRTQLWGEWWAWHAWHGSVTCVTCVTCVATEVPLLWWWGSGLWVECLVVKMWSHHWRQAGTPGNIHTVSSSSALAPVVRRHFPLPWPGIARVLAGDSSLPSFTLTLALLWTSWQTPNRCWLQQKAHQ